MAKKIKLQRGERIIAVVPELAHGPSWANAITWVYIANNKNDALRTECIQPDERAPELHYIYSIGEVVCGELRLAIPVEFAKPEEGDK